ncbi:MAG: hypothetical protein IPO22_16115 [Anaerolineales bacterium]|nr:hypothetical protein [Anaerolineales bacterium]
MVVGGSVGFGNAYAGVVAAREVRGERIESLILLSPKVEGNVITVIDTRRVDRGVGRRFVCGHHALIGAHVVQ